MPRHGNNRRGALGERRVYHAPVDHDRADTVFFRLVPGVKHAHRLRDVLITGTEHVVGKGDLARVDAALADVTEASRRLGQSGRRLAGRFPC